MRAEFYRPDRPDETVGRAVWSEGRVEIQAEGDALDALRRVLRSTPVSVDDPSLRSFGTSGPALLHPGTLRWFRAAAETRGPAEGFDVRFVPEGDGAMGWDPAGAYRTFMAADERKERLGR
jgi:hypothetical protein